MWKRLLLRTTLIGVVLVCAMAIFVIAPRRSDYRLMTPSRDEPQLFTDCTRFYRWWDHYIERLTGWPPCCISVTISGHAENSEVQLGSVCELESRNLSVALNDHLIAPKSNLQWNNVTSLYIRRSSGPFVASVLGATPSLETLTLYDCGAVVDEHLESLGACPSLRELDLDGTGVDGSLLGDLSNSSLKVLSIRYSDCCSQQSLTALSSLDSLQDIYLSGSGSLDINCLRSIRSLKKLVLEGFVVSKDSVENLQIRFPDATIELLP